MAAQKPTVFAVDEYEPQEFDAVLVQERTVVCLRGSSLARVIPLDKVNHVDADPGLALSGHEIPDSFFGGGDFGFAVVSEFPDLERHLRDIDREDY